MAATADPVAPFLAEYARAEAELNGGAPVWLHRLREKAILRFRELGFPTTKSEAWKYTSVAPIAATRFERVREDEPHGVAGEAVDHFTFGVLKCSQLVFINGAFAPKLSYLRWLPEGVRARGLSEVLRTDPSALEPHLGKYAALDGNAFTALNAAFMQEGAFIHVPEGRVVDEPIHLLYVSTARRAPGVSFPRNLIVLERESQATVIESYAGLDRGPYLTNAVTETYAGPGAVLDHYKMQRESDAAFHVATMALHQDRSSTVASTSLSLGGRLVRNDVEAVFLDEGGELDLNGLYAVAGSQHVDNHTRIDHAKPSCTSRELYKGILDGKSRGIFHGQVLVRRDAQKTNARQTNKNLLLSKDAFVDSTPGMEILADDVRCTHGSTIGQLDEDAIFYLRSRAIDEEAARSLLTYAFASELINGIKVASMRIKLDQLILSRLPRAEAVQEAV